MPQISRFDIYLFWLHTTLVFHLYNFSLNFSREWFFFTISKRIVWSKCRRRKPAKEKSMRSRWQDRKNWGPNMKNGIWLNLHAMQLWNVTSVKESRKIVLFATFVSQFKGKTGLESRLVKEVCWFKPDQFKRYSSKTYLRILQSVPTYSVKRDSLFEKCPS